MTAVEFIAFTIAFLALTISFIKRQYDEYQRRQYPERYQAEEEQKEEVLREFLRSLEIDGEGEELMPQRPPKKRKPPPPPVSKKIAKRPTKSRTSKRTVGKEFTFHSKLDDQYEKKTALEQRYLETDVGQRFQEGYGEQIVSRGFRADQEAGAYKIREKEQPSQAACLLDEQKSLKDMVIFREVLGPPKAL